MTSNTPATSPDRAHKLLKNLQKAVEVAPEEALRIYLDLEEPASLRQLAMKIKEQTGKVVSISWLSRQRARGDWRKKRARLKNGGHDVNGAGDAKALTLLSQEGDSFNGSQALRGLQARVVCVIASQIPLETNVDYLKGMAEFYGMLEDLAVKHQNREGPLKSPIQLDDFRTFKRD